MATKDEKQKKGETVEVSREALLELVKKVEEQGKALERLESAADVGRLDAFDSKGRKQGPRRYLLSTYKGKLITGWRTVRDEKMVVDGRLREVQEYEILFEDNTKEKVLGYDNFATVRHDMRLVAEELSRTQDDYGTSLKLKIVGVGDERNAQGPRYEEVKPLFGKEVILDIAFVN